MMKDRHAGIAFILLSALMWAIESVVGKLSFTNSDFLHTLAIRAFFVVITTLVYIFLTRTRTADFRIRRPQLSVIIYIAVVASLFSETVYFLALTMVPVVNALLISHLQPIFIIFIAFFFFKEEKLTKFDYAGVSFMMVSGLLVTTKTLENLALLRIGTFGDLLLLLATMGWATTAITARKYLRGMNAGILTFYRFLLVSIAFAMYLFFTSSFYIANLYQVMVGIVFGLGIVFYYEGLKRIKAAQVSSLELASPFFAAILGFLVLGEFVTPLQLFGILLLFGGIYFLSKKEEL
jgi:drug/metabolite transporter (DMT)-like permease